MASVHQLFMRPITEDDLASYTKLASEAGHGIINIPKDPQLLRDRVLRSSQLFHEEIHFPKGEHYHFVLQDRESGHLAGTCGVYASTGVRQPTFSFRIETEQRSYEELRQAKTLQLLRLISYSFGPSELVALFLLPAFRKLGAGRLLSLSRMLFIADNRDRFQTELIAEMRGVIDDEGHSPFWDCIGGTFSDLTLDEAIRLLRRGRHFVPNILPRYPIYVDLLPRAVQEVIGQVHPRTEPALKMLLAEGFRKIPEIDVLDGAPKISATIDSLRVITSGRTATVQSVVDEEPSSPPLHLISNRRTAQFRCCVGEVKEGGAGIKLASSTASLLDVSEGDSIRYADLRGCLQSDE